METGYDRIIRILWIYEDVEREIIRHEAIDAIINYLDSHPAFANKYRFDFEVWPNEEGGVAAFAFNDIDGILRLITFSTTIQ